MELALRAITANSGMTTHPALSPDGKMLAYASDQATSKDLDIWVLPLAKGGQPIRLTNHEAIETDPDFSPDGGLIVYRSERDGGGIYVVPTQGGEERLLVRGAKSARISPDGSLVAYCIGWTRETQSAIYTIPIGGGTPKRLAADVPWACNPKFTPDGRHIVFEGASSANDPRSDWRVSPVSGGPSIKTEVWPALAAHLSLPPAVIPTVWDVTGDRALFWFSGQIWELDLAPPHWKARGPARPLTSGGTHMFPRAGASGRIVFVNHQTTYRLWKLHVDHNKGRALGEMEPLAIGAGSQSMPSSSADGRFLAYGQFEPAGSSIRLRNLVTSKETTLVTAKQARPHLSPDGKKVAYSVLPDSLYLMSSSGGEAQRLISPEQKLSLMAFGWTPDGRKIVYWYGKPIRYALLDPETLQSAEFLSHPEFAIYTAQISPDQRWVAFNTTDGKQFPLWIAPFRGEKAAERNEWIRLRDDRDSRPWWSPDGNLLYTVSQRDGNHCIWAQPLDPVSKRPKGEAFAVLHLHTAKLRVPVPGFAAFGPAIQPDGLIFTLREESSNVWMAEPRTR